VSSDGLVTRGDAEPAPAPERRLRAHEELGAAAEEAVGALDLDTVLQRFADRARRIAGGDYGAVATVDGEGRTTWRAMSGDISDAWRTTVFPAGQGTAGRVLAANAPVLITDFPNNPEFRADEFPAHAAERMRTAVGVPLRSGGRAFGAAVIGWRRDEPNAADVIPAVQALADVAALAIMSARHLAAAERRALEIEAANEDLARSHAELQHQAALLEEQATELEMLNTELAERNVELDARATELDIVLDQMADGVIISDTTGRIVRANPAAERVHGRPLVSTTPGQWTETFHLRRLDGSPYPEADLPLARAVGLGETVEDAEWLVERPDGEVVRLLGSAAPLVDAGGRRFGAVLVMRDVTERARLVEEAARATSMKERFFAQMSHELRTPVNAVLGYSSLIADGLAGEAPPAVLEMVGRIRRSAQHLLELVNDVLDLSRLEAGKLRIEPEEFDLAALVRDTLPSVEPQAVAKGLALTVTGAPSLRITSDPARVRQILLNLISNAVKFTEGGSVTIDVSPLGDDRARLSVADTGVGIAPEDLERVFGEFVQVGPPKEGGTGLGLTISRRLAHLLGGELTAESAVGRGSRFTLILPVRRPPVSGDEAGPG